MTGFLFRAPALSVLLNETLSFTDVLQKLYRWCKNIHGHKMPEHLRSLRFALKFLFQGQHLE